MRTLSPRKRGVFISSFFNHHEENKRRHWEEMEAEVCRDRDTAVKEVSEEEGRDMEEVREWYAKTVWESWEESEGISKQEIYRVWS
jgi:hypothetical protein